MDPVSLSGLAISCVQVAIQTTSAIIQYANDTRNAKTHIKLLANEAASLQAILRVIEDKLKVSAADPQWILARTHVVRQFQTAYDDLAQMLQLDASGVPRRQSGARMVIETATWPFKKSEVYALLERITRIQQYANTFLLTDQVLLLESVDREQKRRIQADLQRKVLSWLSPLRMSETHQSIMDRVQQGSGQWFLLSPELLSWEAAQYRLLWCSGIPGAGKTFLSALVYDKLQKAYADRFTSGDWGIAILLLSHDERRQQTLLHVLGSLLRQLARSHGEVFNDLAGLYNQYDDIGAPLTLKIVKESLKKAVSKLSRVYLIIDGLDESLDDIRLGLLEELVALPPNSQILISARSTNEGQSEYDAFKRLTLRASEDDIGLFVRNQIQQSPNLRRLTQRQPQLVSEVEAAVIRTAQGMFLLARLHLNSLNVAAALSIRHVRRKLEELPSSIAATYDNAMDRITSQEPEYRQIAIRSLAWVTHALRPLSPKELQHVLADDGDQSQPDEDSLIDWSTIESLCAGLINIDAATGTVKLVHYTSQVYFEARRKELFPRFHEEIVLVCVSHLMLPVMYRLNISQVVKLFPLACYAAEFLGDHARLHPEHALSKTAQESICSLLLNGPARTFLTKLLEHLDLIRAGFFSTSSAVDLADNTTTAGNDSLIDPISFATKAPEVTGLHLAVSMGLANIAAMLVQKMSDINAFDETGRTALHIAVDRGFEKAAEVLVSNGATVDLARESGQSLFLAILSRKWTSVARNIAPRQQESNKNNFLVRLITAAASGDLAVARECLVQNREELANDLGCAVALFVAVEVPDTAMVDIVISNGIDVDSRDTTGRTSLHRATGNGDVEMVRLLIAKGATVDALNDEALTPWSANIDIRRTDALGVLLAAGADPNTRGHNGMSVLFNSAASGNVEVVQLMLKSGTNPSIRTIFDWTPLHWASGHGHISVLRLLLEAGADVDAICDQGFTPLDMALSHQQALAADMLVKAGGRTTAELNAEATPPLSNQSMTSTGTAATILGSLTIDSQSSLAQQPSAVSQQADTRDQNTDRAITSFSFDQPFQQEMTFGQFLFPSSALEVKRNFRHDETRPYQLSHMLDKAVSTLSIRKSKVFITSDLYPLPENFFEATDQVYDVVRLTLDYQELELQSKQPNSASLGNLRMTRTWSGAWTVHQATIGSTDSAMSPSSQLLFRISPLDSLISTKPVSRWTDEQGRTLARTGGACEAIIYPAKDIDPQLLDALICSFIAKTWSDTVTKHKGVYNYGPQDILVR